MANEIQRAMSLADTYERAKSEVRVSDSDIDNVANFEKHKHVVIRKRPEQSLGFMITEVHACNVAPNPATNSVLSRRVML